MTAFIDWVAAGFGAVMPRALPFAEGAETPSMALPVSPQLARPVTRSLL